MQQQPPLRTPRIQGARVIRSPEVFWGHLEEEGGSTSCPATRLGENTQAASERDTAEQGGPWVGGRGGCSWPRRGSLHSRSVEGVPGPHWAAMDTSGEWEWQALEGGPLTAEGGEINGLPNPIRGAVSGASLTRKAGEGPLGGPKFEGCLYVRLRKEDRGAQEPSLGGGRAQGKWGRLPAGRPSPAPGGRHRERSPALPLRLRSARGPGRGCGECAGRSLSAAESVAGLVRAAAPAHSC